MNCERTRYDKRSQINHRNTRATRAGLFKYSWGGCCLLYSDDQYYLHRNMQDCRHYTREYEVHINRSRAPAQFMFNLYLHLSCRLVNFFIVPPRINE